MLCKIIKKSKISIGILIALLCGMDTFAGSGVPLKVAVSVLPPELTSDDRDAGLAAKKALQEGLVTLLHRDGRYQVVERTDPKVLDRIMAELVFQNGGLVADQEAKRLGELAGIEVFVWVNGDLSMGFRGSILTLRARFIDVETSKLLEVFEVTGHGKPALDPDRSAKDAVAQGLKELALKIHME